MDKQPVTSTISLTMDQALFQRLCEHLFPGDHDEHGAVIAAGLAQGARGTRLLARELFLARDGIDYVPGARGYRALNARFVAETSDYCAKENLCYLAIHCHGGSHTVGFSADDLASHERGYPALLDITKGGPVGALVFASDAIAGDIWSPQGRFELNHATIVGPKIHRLYSSPVARPRQADSIYHRHTLLFGDVGQEILANLKVGIIGLGGGGSLISEWLSRLGVGHLVAVDYDRVEPTNLPRLVGATRRDALACLTRWQQPWIQRLRRRFASHKVHVARRVAMQANPNMKYDAIVGNIVDEHTARSLADVDFLFLASDSMQSRSVFNALVHQYLIPGVQIGAKVSACRETGLIEDIFVASRPVLPSPKAGCLLCHELIPADRLREEGLNDRERRAQRYVDNDRIHAPSVITLNALAAARATNDFVMMFTGLYEESVDLAHYMEFVRKRAAHVVEPMMNELCLDCGTTHKSRRARGDRFRLPCRQA